MKNISLVLLLIATCNLTTAQIKKKQILLIGTFHFENPGHDVAQINTFNVMSAKSQNELNKISDKIKKFGPNKIFVEWQYNKQAKLNEFYNSNTDSLLQKDSDEIVQLALRTAKKLNHKQLFAIDYRNGFPYDSLMTGMTEANQLDLMEQNKALITQFEKNHNAKIRKSSLTDLLLYYNKKETDNENIQWYFQVANRTGKTTNFIGASLVSQWYARNLHMYSLIQKLTQSTDQKIMVLLGAGHAAMLREFVAHDPNFEIVEVATVLK